MKRYKLRNSKGLIFEFVLYYLTSSLILCKYLNSNSQWPYLLKKQVMALTRHGN